MTSNLLPARIIYLSVWFLTAIYTILCETNLLPTAYIQNDNQAEYMLHMLCIVLTLSCSWFGLRLFVFKRIRNKLQNNPHQALPQLNLLRIGIVATPVIIDIAIYYALLSSTTPLFCMLIALTSLLFCWPKTGE